MDFILSKISNSIGQNKQLVSVYISNILLSIHYYLLVYINSSFLNIWFTDSQISSLYIIGSILNLLLIINVSKILNKIGNYKLIIYASLIEMLAISGLFVGQSKETIGIYFVIHHIFVPIIIFSLDVFLENLSVDEQKTGSIRGAYLTASNITLVLAPLLVSFILNDNQNYRHIYLTSLIIIIPLLIFVQKYFKNFTHLPVSHLKIKETISYYIKNKKVLDVSICNFILQIFYAFMIIYSPIYLHKYIGFNWSEIGIMFTIMLLPFVLFELPIGEISDKKYGEKEIMTIGFIITGISTIIISFVTAKLFLIWTIILFLTRTGASFIEITTESYFFKQVKSNQTDVISFFRINRPLSFIIAPIIATVMLELIPYNYMFLIIGIFTIIIGTKYSLAIKDTL